MTSALAIHTTVAELCSVFQAAEAEVRAAWLAVDQAEERLNATFAMAGPTGATFNIGVTRHMHRQRQPIEDVIADLRRRAWYAVVERLELRRMMSPTRWNELDKQLREDDSWPELSEEQVSAFAAQFSSALPLMFEEAVREVFKYMRPSRSELKTNSKFEIGPKVILSYVVTRDFGRWHVRYCGYRSDEQMLLALENVLNGLDGRGTVAKSHYSEISDAIKASVDGAGETSLFKFRCFANGNLHLTFKRLDLVAKLNAIAGGDALKPSMEAA